MIIKSYVAEKDHNLFNSNLLLFYGPNLGLKEDFKKKIKIKFGKSELQNYTQDEILKDNDKFFSNLLNISLFENQKVFIIDQCNDKVLELIESLEKKLNDQKIFLFSDQLDKKSKLRSFFEKSQNFASIACYEDNEINIKRVIEERLKGYKGLTGEIINMLIDNCNNDRVKLNNELNKIISYFDKKEVKKSEIEEILNIKVNDNFNSIKDTVLRGDKIRTNKLLNNIFIEPEKNIFYLSLINNRLNKLNETILLSKDSPIENVVAKIKPPIFWKDKPIFIDQLKKWKLKNIKLAQKKTYKHELVIKSNANVNKDVLLKKLLIDLCRLANAS